MKKLFTLCLVMAMTFTVKAQTKQETIEWLNTNGSSLLSVNNKIGDEDHIRTFVELKKDTIHLYVKHDCSKCPGGGSSNKYHYFIPLKSILFQDVNTLVKEEDGQFAWFVVQLSRNTIIKYTRDGEWNQDEESSYSIYYKKDDEANAKRVLKAIMHLAKLSGAKENKQTF